MGWCCCGQTQTDGSSFNSTPLIQHQHITLLHSHLLQFPLPKNKRSSLFHFWGTPFYFFFSSFSLLPLGLLLLSFDLKVELQRVIDMIYLLDSSVTSLHWCVFFLFFLNMHLFPIAPLFLWDIIFLLVDFVDTFIDKKNMPLFQNLQCF